MTESFHTRVFVGGFGGDAGELELRAAFLSVGVALGRIEVVMSPATGCSRGFAFVTLPELPVYDVAVAPAPRTTPTLDIPAPPHQERNMLDRMRTAIVRGRPVTIQMIAASMPHRPTRVPETS